MHTTSLNNIEKLRNTFFKLCKGKQSLLDLIQESELSESIYNSNAIENSTLSLDETEKILLHQEIPPFHSQREVFEAVNLERVTTYLDAKIREDTPLTENIIFTIHGTLLSHIHDDFAGRYRIGDEYVRVGRHIAPSPEHIPQLMNDLFAMYKDESIHILERIIRFHLEFERIHPFCDGNGRTGRALINFQLQSHGYPPIIVRNKGKHKEYYPCFTAYENGRKTKVFERLLVLLLKESLHKRIAYLQEDEKVFLSTLGREYPQHSQQSLGTLAKKQSIPAFRERGRWKVGRKMFEEWSAGFRR